MFSYSHTTLPLPSRAHHPYLFANFGSNIIESKYDIRNTKSSQQTIQSIHILDTSRIIEEPPKICDISGGFCCNGFHFDIEPNETISYNDTLRIVKGDRIIGNITKLRYGCHLRGSRSLNNNKLQQTTNYRSLSLSLYYTTYIYLNLIAICCCILLIHCAKRNQITQKKIYKK